MTPKCSVRWMLISLGIIFTHAASFAREISFTFDDAPILKTGYFSGKDRTTRLIENLKRAQVDQAAFFCNTHEIGKEGLDRLKAYAKAGHLIANHTASHPNLHNIGAKAFVEDIERAHQVLIQIPNFTPWFRFPFLKNGETDDQRHAVMDALNRMSYSHGYVTIDNYDYYMSHLFREAVLAKQKIDFEKLKSLYVRVLWDSIQFYDALAMKLIGRSPRHVLLLHENDLAALFIEDLVQKLRSQGWKIIAPTQAYEDPIAKMDPDINYGQSLLARIGKAKGMADEELRHPTENEEFLRDLFKSSTVFR